MSTERMLRAGQLATFTRLAVRSRDKRMADEPGLMQLLAALDEAQTHADNASNKRKERTLAQCRCAARIVEIRADLLRILGEYEDRIKERFDSVIEPGSSRVSINDMRYDHLVSWRVGPKTDNFVPLGSAAFVVDENDDHTDGKVVIFTRTATPYSEEDAKLTKHPRFKEATTSIATLILDALLEVDGIRSVAEAKVGPIDERVVVAVLEEAGRRVSANMAVAIDAEIEFERRDIFGYDAVAIKKDIDAISRRIASR